MTRHRIAGLAVLLGPAVLAAGCSTSTVQRRSAEQTNRFQVLLAPQIVRGQVAVEPLPDGARVVLPEALLFPPGSAELDDGGRYLLASVVEGLLAPPLLRIDVAAAPGASPALQQAREQSVTAFMQAFQAGPAMEPRELEQTLAPSPAAPATGAANAMSISVAVR